jgi:hypothetical protein
MRVQEKISLPRARREGRRREGGVPVTTRGAHPGRGVGRPPVGAQERGCRRAPSLTAPSRTGVAPSACLPTLRPLPLTKASLGKSYPGQSKRGGDFRSGDALVLSKVNPISRHSCKDLGEKAAEKIRFTATLLDKC